MGKRLVDNIPVLTATDLGRTRKDKKTWVTVNTAAKKERVTIQTILNKIRRSELYASNFEGRIFVLL